MNHPDSERTAHVAQSFYARNENKGAEAQVSP